MIFEKLIEAYQNEKSRNRAMDTYFVFGFFLMVIGAGLAFTNIAEVVALSYYMEAAGLGFVTFVIGSAVGFTANK